jgi:hypothetical protein
MREKRARAHQASVESAGTAGRTITGRSAEDERPREPAPPTGALSLWLDNYDDIFYDFDRHPYGQRALSEDFLAEARRAVRNRHDEVPELRLLVRAAVRRVNDETIIRKRLRDHFRKHADRLSRRRHRMIWTILGVAAAGFALMTASTLLRRQPEGSPA